MREVYGSNGGGVPTVKRPRSRVATGGLLMALAAFAIYGGLHATISHDGLRMGIFAAIMLPLYIAALRWVNRGTSDCAHDTNPRVKRPLFRVTIGGMLMLMTLVAIYCGLHLTIANEAIRLGLMFAISFSLFVASLGWARWTKRASN